jgi:hypothetical protein
MCSVGWFLAGWLVGRLFSWVAELVGGKLTD